MNDHDDIYRLENDPVDRHGRGAQHEPSDGSRSPYQPAPRFFVRCVRCGYDLVGLTVGSYCPECGHRVGLFGSHEASTSGAAVTSLVLGIIAIVSCVFYGVPGLIFGPLALYFASRAKKQVIAGQAAANSLGLASAGKVLGIVGIVLSSLYILIIVGIILFAGAGGIFP